MFGTTARASLFPYETLPPYGLSPAQLTMEREHLAEDLQDMREYLLLATSRPSNTT